MPYRTAQWRGYPFRRRPIYFPPYYPSPYRNRYPGYRYGPLFWLLRGIF